MDHTNTQFPLSLSRRSVIFRIPAGGKKLTASPHNLTKIPQNNILVSYTGKVSFSLGDLLFTYLSSRHTDTENFGKGWFSIIVFSVLMKTCAAYSSSDAAIGKQRQMLSSILLSPSFLSPNSFSSFPYPPISDSSRLSFFLLGGQVTNKHQNFSLSDTIPARISRSTGAVCSVSICMEIGYSPGDTLGSYQYYCSPRKDIPKLSC